MIMITIKMIVKMVKIYNGCDDFLKTKCLYY